MLSVKRSHESAFVPYRRDFKKLKCGNNDTAAANENKNNDDKQSFFTIDILCIILNFVHEPYLWFWMQSEYKFDIFKASDCISDACETIANRLISPNFMLYDQPMLDRLRAYHAKIWSKSIVQIRTLPLDVIVANDNEPLHLVVSIEAAIELTVFMEEYLGRKATYPFTQLEFLAGEVSKGPLHITFDINLGCICHERLCLCDDVAVSCSCRPQLDCSINTTGKCDCNECCTCISRIPECSCGYFQKEIDSIYGDNNQDPLRLGRTNNYRHADYLVGEDTFVYAHGQRDWCQLKKL